MYRTKGVISELKACSVPVPSAPFRWRALCSLTNKQVKKAQGLTGDKVNKCAVLCLIINTWCAILSRGNYRNTSGVCTSHRKLVTYSITVVGFNERPRRRIRGGSRKCRGRPDTRAAASRTREPRLAGHAGRGWPDWTAAGRTAGRSLGPVRVSNKAGAQFSLICSGGGTLRRRHESPRANSFYVLIAARPAY